MAQCVPGVSSAAFRGEQLQGGAAWRGVKYLEQEGIGSASSVLLRSQEKGAAWALLLKVPQAKTFKQFLNKEKRWKEKQGVDQGGGAVLSSGNEVNELGQTSALQKLAPWPGEQQ